VWRGVPEQGEDEEAAALMSGGKVWLLGGAWWASMWVKRRRVLWAWPKPRWALIKVL
jgi:hypothetical protein